ncbi:hypothetical protein BK816_00975 [Boudabousia tangfeifanii]|uniref:DUF3168 domain-containing protein n=1 Tax=Boudabousia tangfeifanii TaxID=1912795 RepID=A0A1D9MM83_9ACTO|nr:hypothetical protein [Boudabousia tangfeifanii]AOZ73402.1 hypothetical protein BK816_00975 [Boudabousia tangfeifanii]
MECLEILVGVFQRLGLQVFTGTWPALPASDYAVLLPLVDIYDLHADNTPSVEIQYVRINLFSQENYLPLVHRLLPLLRQKDLTITERRYIGHDPETGYHHYAVEVALTTDPH